MAARAAYKRPFPPLFLTTGHYLQHIDGLVRMVRGHKTGAHMLCGSSNRRVAGIEIHFPWIFNISWHHRALKKMNMLHGVHDACGIIKILQHRFSIFAFFSIHNMDSRTRSTEICPVAGEVHIVTRVLARKDDIPCCRGDDILNQ